MAREVGIEMGKQTFNLDLFCLNCGNRWEAMIPVGYDFFGFTTNTAAWEACYGTPSYYGNKPRTGYTVVSCPVCESARVERAVTVAVALDVGTANPLLDQSALLPSKPHIATGGET